VRTKERRVMLESEFSSIHSYFTILFLLLTHNLLLLDIATYH